MHRGALKNEIFEKQGKLWIIETKLNLPLAERVLLAKGWAELANDELETLASKINASIERRSEELAQMEAEFGKADDVRKEIEIAVAEYREACRRAEVTPTFLFPRGFRFMNAKELQFYLKNAREWAEHANQRVLKRQATALQKQEAVRRSPQAAEKNAAELHEINALRDARLRLINEIAAPLQMLEAALEMDRTLAINVPKVSLPLRTSLMLGLMSEAEFTAIAKQHRRDIESAIRALREPLRRAHQSAQARRATELDFEAYLKQRGFETLLK